MAVDYLESIRKKALQKMGTRTYSGATASREMSSDAAAAMQSYVDQAAGSGAGRPTREQFMSVVPGRRQPARSLGYGSMAAFYAPSMMQSRQYSMPTYEFNADAYQSGTFNWMRQQDRYKDWSDADIQAFVSQTMNMDPQAALAVEMGEADRIAVAKANEENRQRYDEVKAEWQLMNEGLNPESIKQRLAEEAQAWNQHNAARFAQAMRSFADMGRRPSGWEVASLRRELEVDKQLALQKREVDLQQEMFDRRMQAVSMLHEINSSVVTQTPDPGLSMAMAQALAGAK